jgi:hypothetical protein
VTGFESDEEVRRLVSVYNDVSWNNVNRMRTK